MSNRDFTNEDFDRATGQSETWAPFAYSENINEIAAALAKAQSEMEAAQRNATNTFFKSTYADLHAVQQACMPALNKNGIAVLQSPSREGGAITVTTMLMHSSGQWIKGQLSLIPAKTNNAQEDGKVISYARRYMLSSMAGVAQEDDDGETAVDREGQEERKKDNRAAGAKKAAATREKKKEAKNGIVDAFERIGLGEAWLDARLGKPVGKVTDGEIKVLQGEWKELAACQKENPEGFAELAESMLPQEA